MTRSFPGGEREGRGEGEERDWAFQDDKAESFKTCEGQDRNRRIHYGQGWGSRVLQDRESQELWTFRSHQTPGALVWWECSGDCL